MQATIMASCLAKYRNNFATESILSKKFYLIGKLLAMRSGSTFTELGDLLAFLRADLEVNFPETRGSVILKDYVASLRAGSQASIGTPCNDFDKFIYQLIGDITPMDKHDEGIASLFGNLWELALAFKVDPVRLIEESVNRENGGVW